MVGAEKKDSLMAGRTATHAVTRMGSNDGGSGPEWATGLKRLYDQVVDEPIPDSFMDLLSKLDDTSR
ncbi:hypothetical protein PK98_09900 [Croceibacterium mercuriale]|uniref:Anti-sigma factor NepR domain-containing protein n=1 Tax=Croceibacterium mercuriale TaxID=1572751 RepID=A0A0B2BS19_9SPHN|nr:hypothetical protein PK98_09900 [Croceibacterium mercuriale]